MRGVVTCMRSVGVLTHPCDEVHCSSQRAAAASKEGVVGAQMNRWLHCGQKEYVHPHQTGLTCHCWSCLSAMC